METTATNLEEREKASNKKALKIDGVAMLKTIQGLNRSNQKGMFLHWGC